MLNSQKVMHIVIAIFLSLLFSCFIGQLLHPSQYAIFILVGYFAIFLVYTLKTYAAFHYPPTEPNLISTKINISLIFKFKLTQERRRQIEEMMTHDQNKKDSLVEEYIKLQKSPSFCDICEYLQPPRSQHCDLCHACIMGKHFHSQLLGFCIGESNQRIYLSYLLITTILMLYSLSALIIVYVVSDSFSKLQFSTQALFFLIIVIEGTGVCFFAFCFRKFFCLVRDNKTYVQSKNKIISELSLFEKKSEKQKVSLSSVLKDLINFDTLGEVSSWVIEAQALTEEQ